jgi:hypothetical protein
MTGVVSVGSVDSRKCRKVTGVGKVTGVER